MKSHWKEEKWALSRWEWEAPTVGTPRGLLQRTHDAAEVKSGRIPDQLHHFPEAGKS